MNIDIGNVFWHLIQIKKALIPKLNTSFLLQNNLCEFTIYNQKLK